MVKLLENKGRKKRLIKNWRRISLLNINLKILSEVLAAKLKLVLPSRIASQQTAHVQNKHIVEGERLISDVLDISGKLNIDGYSATVNIRKDFDSLDHRFLLVV